ncbi:MAG: PDZ domain-containing protein [Thermoleophilia bacterium]|jgi:S1-C subfamily serine protease|nr:PDZ domain-containing protein [Thermoleophilia bacterium]
MDPGDVFAAVESAVGRIGAAVGPAVVGIGRGWGRGTGVVVAPGRVLAGLRATAGDEVEVVRGDGAGAGARVAGADPESGLAVLEMDTGGVVPVGWDPAAPPVAAGRSVFALARPGGRALRVSWGLVTSAEAGVRGPRGRMLRGVVEHTAPLPRGSAGAPLVDVSGRLVGVSVLRMDAGLILAVPADAALAARIEAMATGQAPAGRRLGAAVSPPWVARRMRRGVGLPDRDGVLVRAVDPGGPGERAGLRRGDLIVSAAGRPVRGLDDLQAVLDDPAVPGPLGLVVVRGVEEVHLEAPVGPAAAG